MLKFFSPILAHRRSFLSGAARVLDMGNTLARHHYVNNAQEMDYMVISSDWMTVGEDILDQVDERSKNVSRS